MLFDDSLVGLIVDETNRYAEYSLSLQGTMKQWSTNAEEIGFMILMGINRLSEIRDYWCTNKALRISRDRFEEITRYLHFVDTLCVWRSELFMSPESQPHHLPSQRPFQVQLLPLTASSV